MNPYVLLFWVAFLYIFIHSYQVISPILLAFLLVILGTLALNPIVASMRRTMGGRSAATGIVVLIFLVIAVFTGWAAYRPVKKSAGQFIERLPQYWERIQKPLLKLQQKAAVSEQKMKEQVTTEIISEDVARTNQALATAITNAQTQRPGSRPTQSQDNTPQEQPGFLQSGLSQVLTGVAGSFKSIASGTFELGMIAVTVFVGVVFSLLNPRPIVAFTFSLVPEKHHEKARRIITRIVRIVPQWAFATLMGMGAIGILVFVLMWFVLGFQDALLLGLIAFVLEAVPYVGPILAVIPALLLAFGEGGMTPMWVLIAYAAVQAIENNLVAPLIMAERLKLHPVAVLFAILLCAITFGVLGAILAAPLVVVANILHDEIFKPRFLPNVSDKELNNMAHEVLYPPRITAEAKKGNE